MNENDQRSLVITIFLVNYVVLISLKTTGFLFKNNVIIDGILIIYFIRNGHYFYLNFSIRLNYFLIIL